MSRYKILLVMIFSMLLGNSVVVFAVDYDKGLEAYELGDYETALAEWMPLAEQGNVDAQFYLGVMYDNGRGVPEIDKTAVMWYTKAAKQGYAEAQYNLGVMYENGEGVLENDKTAVMWYTKAAQQGDADVQYHLGLMYQFGHGVLTDYVRAYMWYNLADYNGNAWSAGWKSSLAKEMTSTDISKAQEMSGRCLESGYTDC